MNTPTIKLNQQYTYNLKQVLFATQMDEEELGHLITETADTWLRRFFKGKIDHDSVLHNAAFRKWWRMHWLDRDDRFFLTKVYESPEDFRFSQYRMLHQCVFNLLQPSTQFMYQDFLDMREVFEASPVTSH
ncbi:hypothetical protein ABDK00_001495 [Niabella insulamsoli]|uniref:hypothetical protein n=1 Tax=Niabella insulamsoli TaxID=3144874 RepID=UPI0031FC8ED2